MCLYPCVYVSMCICIHVCIYPCMYCTVLICIVLYSIVMSCNLCVYRSHVYIVLHVNYIIYTTGYIYLYIYIYHAHNLTLTHTIWFFICPLKYLVDMIIDAKTRIRKRESIHGFPFSSVHSNIRLLFGWRLGQFLTRGRATWKLVRVGLKRGGQKSRSHLIFYM